MKLCGTKETQENKANCFIPYELTLHQGKVPPYFQANVNE